MARLGTLGLKGFFLTFFWLRSRRGQNFFFFVLGTLFGNLKVNSGPFWVPKRGPGGYFLEVLGGSGEGLNFGLIVRHFFYKNSKHAKSQKHRILLPCAVFREGHRFGKSARSSTNMQVFLHHIFEQNRAKIEETSEKNGDRGKSR